jgi:hypothetical protein
MMFRSFSISFPYSLIISKHRPIQSINVPDMRRSEIPGGFFVQQPLNR